MQTRKLLSLVMVCCAVVAPTAFAQIRDAGSKIRGDTYQSGAARTYQSHARDYGRFLFYQAKTDEGCAPEQARQYVGAIRQNIQSANKALDKVQAANPKDETVKKSVESIKKMHDKVLAHCDTIDSEVKKGGAAKGVTICDCCVDLTGDLDKASTETDKLLKHLKVEELPEMKKSTDNKSEKKSGQ